MDENSLKYLRNIVAEHKSQRAIAEKWQPTEKKVVTATRDSIYLTMAGMIGMIPAMLLASRTIIIVALVAMALGAVLTLIGFLSLIVVGRHGVQARETMARLQGLAMDEIAASLEEKTGS